MHVRTRHRWTGWQNGALRFETADGAVVADCDVAILAMGGASWSRLGSDGRWAETLEAQGVNVAAFKPSNCGFETGWDAHVGEKFGGTPLKSIGLSFGEQAVLGEAMVTTTGIEGGAIYALSPALRDAIATQGEAVLSIDLKPDMSAEQIVARLVKTRTADSLSNRLRKALRLPPVAISVLREGGALPSDPAELAARMKSVKLRLSGVSGIDRAISTAGGVTAASVDDRWMLTSHPGVFAAGEMLDWEAPTGGYLLQACFASGRAAAIGALDWLGESNR